MAGQTILVATDSYETTEELSLLTEAMTQTTRAHLLLVCFSLSQQATLFEIMEKWHTVIISRISGTPVMVVGTLLEGDKPRAIKAERGRAVASLLEGSYYEFGANDVGNKVLCADIVQAVLGGRTQTSAEPMERSNSIPFTLMGNLFQGQRSRKPKLVCLFLLNNGFPPHSEV